MKVINKFKMQNFKLSLRKNKKIITLLSHVLFQNKAVLLNNA